MKKSFYELKVVKTRKDHECVVCSNIIPKGSMALVENGFNKTEGFFNNYFHKDEENGCHLDYLDCMQPSETDVCEKIKDPTHFGQIFFNRWREVRG